jgi:hypothetical protein
MLRSYDAAGTRPIHHAWVKDKITGKRHEVTRLVTPSKGDVFIGKEFTELRNLGGKPITSAKEWATQLTMAAQLELLTEYEVGLLAVYGNMDDDDYDEEYADPNLDMSLTCDWADYILMKAKGTERKPSGFTRKTGHKNWHYEWHIWDSKSAAAPAAVKAQAAEAIA